MLLFKKIVTGTRRWSHHLEPAIFIDELCLCFKSNMSAWRYDDPDHPLKRTSNVSVSSYPDGWPVGSKWRNFQNLAAHHVWLRDCYAAIALAYLWQTVNPTHDIRGIYTLLGILTDKMKYWRLVSISWKMWYHWLQYRIRVRIQISPVVCDGIALPFEKLRVWTELSPAQSRKS